MMRVSIYVDVCTDSSHNMPERKPHKYALFVPLVINVQGRQHDPCLFYFKAARVQSQQHGSLSTSRNLTNTPCL